MERIDAAVIADALGATSQVDRALLHDVVALAVRAHEGQTRRSGEPYVTHPITVAALVAEWGMDAASVCAAVLHDVVEDTQVGLEEIRAVMRAHDADIAEEVVKLVAGLTKLDGLKLVGSADADTKQAANLQKLLLAIAEDPRVLVVKIADRLHNVRTISALREDKARRIARETMDVYSPLAARLGMARIAGELDDLCFAVLFPERCAELQRLIAERAGEREAWIEEVAVAITDALATAGVAAKVRGRAKGLWSVYEKMVHKGRTFDQVLDLVGVRIVVSDVAACYATLGVVHGLYAPIPGRFKDWIATPRYNLYQALHTTVMTAGGTPLEVQIRTKEMHQRAEWGVAAHWRYKDHRPVVSELPNWMQRLGGVADAAADAASFLDQVTAELASDEVLCFTPRGDVVSLPANATPVDFAYAVHTQIGHACTGARVNGQLVSLATRLRTGDRVEILTGAQSSPRREWLTTAVTSRARSRIKHWFAREDRRSLHEAGRTAIGRALAERGVPGRIVRFDQMADVAVTFGCTDSTALLEAVGNGTVDAAAVAEQLAPGHVRTAAVPTAIVAQPGDTSAAAGVFVVGLDGAKVAFATCCAPRHGDFLLGMADTTTREVDVHRTDCAVALQRAASRHLVEVLWRDANFGVQRSVVVEALDRPGLLGDVAQAIARAGGEIVSSASGVGRDMVSRQRFEVRVADEAAFALLLEQLGAVSGVFSATEWHPGDARH